MTDPSSPWRAFTEEVRRATDLVTLVREHVPLTSAGAELVGRSPLHEEKTPSFYVNPAKQVWFDFSGGAHRGGDCFDFVQAVTGCDFAEARATLAERAGVRPPDLDPQAFERQLQEMAQRRELLELRTRAALYYHRRLPPALRRELLREGYGFSDAVIDSFKLGYADGSLWRWLTEDQGVPRELALGTGLFVELKDGRVVDFLDQRLVLPFWRRGHAGTLAGRRTRFTPDKPWEQQKYKRLPGPGPKHPQVSPLLAEEPLFNEDAAAGATTLLLTEGLPDCVAATQAGHACIAAGSTRFSEAAMAHLLKLLPKVKRVLLVNDAEESGAGFKGAMATAAELHAAGVDVRVVELPRPAGVSKIDLCDFLRVQGAEALKPLLDAAPRYLERRLMDIPRGASHADLEPQLGPVLREVAPLSPLQREHYLRFIRDRFGLGLRLVRRLVREAAPPRESSRAEIAMKGDVQEEDDRYFIDGEEGRVWLSTFRLEVVERVHVEGVEHLRVLAHSERGSVLGPIDMPPQAWVSRRAFLGALASPDLQWFGSDDHVQGVLRRLAAEHVPTRRGTTMLGLHDTADGPRWVMPDLVLGPDGPVEDGELVYQDADASLARRMRLVETPTPQLRELVQEAWHWLPRLNAPEVILPSLGWFFAAALKPRVIDRLGHFPILMVWGTQGSGKSTLLTQVLWPLCGLVETEPFSATDTYFASIRRLSSTTSIPVVIDEYKPSDMPQNRLEGLHRLLRRSYGGEVEERGRADQGINRYKLAAPVCLAGEACPEDPALLDRFVVVSPNRNALRQRPELREALAALRGLQLHRVARPYLSWALARDSAAELEAAIVGADAVIDSLPQAARCSPRCRDNLRVVVFGLAMFSSFGKAWGATLPALDVPRALAACIDGAMDGEEGGKNPLDRFIEECATLAHLGQLREGVHYAVQGQETHLHLRACLRVYQEQQRRAGLSDETNGLGPLKRLARESLEREGYVTSMDKRPRLGGGRPRCLTLDLSRASAHLEVDTFPTEQPRGWDQTRLGEEDER